MNILTVLLIASAGFITFMVSLILIARKETKELGLNKDEK